MTTSQIFNKLLSIGAKARNLKTTSKSKLLSKDEKIFVAKNFDKLMQKMQVIADKEKLKRDEKIFISKAQLTDRDGWSQACIKLFSVEHDKECVNPVFKSAPPVKLYSLDKIISIEKLVEFGIFKEKNLKRRAIRLKVSDVKRQELLTYIDKLTINVPYFDKDNLIKRACSSYNRHKQDIMYEREDYSHFQPATIDSDIDFLSRITTNFLRHKLTNYEKELDKLFGKIGKNEAYVILKHKINSAIFAKYDWIHYDIIAEY